MKAPASKLELTFTGKNGYSFQVPTRSSATWYDEELSMEFRTSRATGVLAHAGDPQEFFVLGLDNGDLLFKLDVKGQLHDRLLTIAGILFHNNQWHSVVLQRRAKQVTKKKKRYVNTRRNELFAHLNYLLLVFPRRSKYSWTTCVAR